MKQMVLQWIVNGLAVVLGGYLFPNLIRYTDMTAVAIFAVVLGLLNAFLRPLLKIFLFPVAVITLGLGFFLANVIIFWLAGALVPGVEVRGLLGATVGALMVTAVNVLVIWLLRAG
jgi:putative membrane protein